MATGRQCRTERQRERHSAPLALRQHVRPLPLRFARCGLGQRGRAQRQLRRTVGPGDVGAPVRLGLHPMAHGRGPRALQCADDDVEVAERTATVHDEGTFFGVTGWPGTSGHVERPSTKLWILGQFDVRILNGP